MKVLILNGSSDVNGNTTVAPEKMKKYLKRRMLKRRLEPVWSAPDVGALADFIKETGMPTTLRELGVNEHTDLKEIAYSCNLAPGSYKKITHEETLEIFRECFRWDISICEQRERRITEMGILFINGSPNKKGNTAALAGALLSGKEYEMLSLTDYRIGSYGQDSPDDQLAVVIEKMRMADVIVIGSPLYWHNICGSVRNMLDRFYGLVEEGSLSGRTLYFLFQGTAPEKWMMEAGEYTMKRFAGLYGMKYAGWPKAWAAFRLAKEIWNDEADVTDAKTAHENSMLFPIGQPNDAFAQYFVGQSYLAPVSKAQVGIFNVTFEPGCRNNWHIHYSDNGGGQILICVAGRGFYQEWGKEPVCMTAGDVVNIPAGVKHWHGAGQDSWFSHLAVEVPGENGHTEWCEPVSREDYENIKSGIFMLFVVHHILNGKWCSNILNGKWRV